MFGLYRTLLALAVAAHHLISIPIIGHYAVHGFFILSGYLMTYVMNNSYGYSYNGVKSFAKNRFLRLYPSYWAILVISIGIVMYWGGEQSQIYRKFIYIPSELSEWIQNSTLIFINVFPSVAIPRLSPPAWALTIELIFYLLIAIGISKTKNLTLVWLIMSVIYMAVTHFADLGYGYRYSIVFAGTLPFSVGATIYHFREQLCTIFQSISKPIPITVLFLCFVFNSFLAAEIRHFHWGRSLFYLSFYINYLINTLLVISLINGRFPLVSKKLDQKLGDFSYPIYLFHWQAGFLSSMLIFGEPLKGLNQEGVISFIVSIAICILVSWMIIKFIDQPIQRFRVAIKEEAIKTNALGCQKASLRFSFR